MSETGNTETPSQCDAPGQLNPDERLVIAALHQELYELAASYSDLLHNAPGAFLILTRRLRLLRSTIETRLEFIQLNPNNVRLHRLSLYRSSLLQLGSQVLSLSEAINHELQAVNAQKLNEKAQETILPGSHPLSKSLSRNSYSESDLNDPKRLLSVSAGPKDTSNSSGTTNSDFRKSYSSPRSLECYSSLSDTYENFVLNNITVDTVKISCDPSSSTSGSQVTSTDGSISGVTPSSNMETSSPALASTSEDFERGTVGMQEFYISPNTTFYQMESPSVSLTVPSADFGDSKTISTKPAPPKVRINRKQFLPASVDPQPYIDSSASNRSSRSCAAATLQQGSAQSGQTLYSLPADAGSSGSGVKRAQEESASEAPYECIGGTDDYEPILRHRAFGRPSTHRPYQLKHQLSEESGIRPVWDLSEGNLSSSFERTLLHTEPAVREHRKAMLKPGHLRKGMPDHALPGSASRTGRDNLSEPNTPMQDKIPVHASAAPSLKLRSSDERVLLGASSNSDSSAKNVPDSPDILVSSQTKQIPSRQAMIPGSLNSSIQVLSSIKGLLKEDLAKRVHDAITCTSERKQEIKALTAALPIYSCVKGSARLVQLHPIDLQFDNSEGESSEYDNAFQVDPNGRSVMSESAVSASSVSMDYYLPPDDTSATGDSANAAMLLAAGPSQSYPLPDSKVVKSGFVNKLSGKFKVWKRFWCILTTQSLLFYPAKPGAKQKAELCVSLEEIESVNRSSLHDYGIDLKVKGSEKTLYLSCDSTSERSLWYFAMVGSIKRHNSELIVQRNSGQLLHKGWLKRVKCGSTKKFYCRLYGHFLVYYKRHTDSVPTGSKDLSNSIIYEVTGGSSSESDGDYSEVTSRNRTLAIRSKAKEPVYFICSEEADFIKWRHLLTQLECRIEPPLADPPPAPKTPTPKSNRKVMPRRQSWLNSPFSTHLTLLVSDDFHGNFCHSDQPIETPVSKVPADLSNSAMLLFHLILLYIYPSTEGNAMEKTDLVKRLSLHCFDLPLLKDELYLQLVMQTIPSLKSKLASKERKSKFKCSSPKFFCSAHSSSSTISATSQQPRTVESDIPASIHSSWQLLSLIAPLFLPSDLVLSFVDHYLNEQLKSNNALIAKFASFCRSCILRTRELGGRSQPPSSLEVNSMLLRQPFSVSDPFSVPVSLLGKPYKVVGFHGSSAVSDLCKSAIAAFELPSTPNVVYSLYIKDNQSFVYLDPTWKVCDVLSKCDNGVSSSTFEDVKSSPASIAHLSMKDRPSRTPVDFYLRCRSYQLSFFDTELTDIELETIVYQIQFDLLVSYYPVDGVTLLITVAHLCQALKGDYKQIIHKDQTLGLLIKQLFPLVVTQEEDRVMHLKLLLLEQWGANCSKTKLTCLRNYISSLSGQDHLGARFFPCRCIDFDLYRGMDLLLAVSEQAIHVFDANEQSIIEQVNLVDLVAFGGQNYNFFLVTNFSKSSCYRKMQFTFTSPLDIMECSQIVCDYLKAVDARIR